MSEPSGCSDACSMPSLPVSGGETSSMPTLSVSASSVASMPSLSISAGGTETEISKSADSALSACTENCAVPALSGAEDSSLPTYIESAPSEECVAQRESDDTAKWMGRIQHTMLQVSIDKTKLAERDETMGSSLLHCTPADGIALPSQAPYLHTSHRPEIREKNVQSRLLREADCRILREPIGLPVYPHSKAVKTQTKQQSLEWKRGGGEATCVSRGTQSAKIDRPKSSGNVTKGVPTPKDTKAAPEVAAKPLRNPEKSTQCTPSAVLTTEVPSEKSRGVSFAAGDEGEVGGKSTAIERDIHGTCEHSPPQLSPCTYTYEPLYKVLAVSSARKAPAKTAEVEKSTTKTTHNKAGGENPDGRTQRNKSRIDASGGRAVAAPCSSSNNPPNHTAGRRTSFVHRHSADAQKSLNAKGTQSEEKPRRDQISGSSLLISQQQQDNAEKGLGNDVSLPVDQPRPLGQQPLPNTAQSDKRLYQQKLLSLEQELNGIRHLLEDTKKSKLPTSNRIPTSVAVPVHIDATPCDFTCGSSIAQSSLRSISNHKQDSNARKQTAGGNLKFAPDSFSPNSSWGGGNHSSLGLVDARRRPSNQLLQPRRSMQTKHKR